MRLTCGLLIVETVYLKRQKHPEIRSIRESVFITDRMRSVILLTKSNTCEPLITWPLNTNSPEDVHEDSGLALDILSKMYF